MKAEAALWLQVLGAYVAVNTLLFAMMSIGRLMPRFSLRVRRLRAFERTINDRCEEGIVPPVRPTDLGELLGHRLEKSE